MIANNTDGPLIGTNFYSSQALPYLTERDQKVIRQRLIDAPRALRQSTLAPHIAPLGETGGDAAFQVFRAYLDAVEVEIAKIVVRHSPSFWVHLHRRIRPMLSDEHTGKTDENTVHLVRRIAELSYAKHGDLSIRNDLGPILGMRLDSFMDGIWYEAVANAFGSKLKAKEEFKRLKFTKQVVMTNFEALDLHDLYSIEGLAYEYWWASAVMRSIGKGSPVKWQDDPPAILYCDHPIHPMCFELYDNRINNSSGFQTRSGTWTHSPSEDSGEDIATGQDEIFYAQLNANAEPEEYAAWNPQSQNVGRGYGVLNFHVTRFPLAAFRSNHTYIAASFERKHGVSFDAVMFAVWASSFLAVFKGWADQLPTKEERLGRTMANWNNLLFRGYVVTPVTLPQMAKDAVFCADYLNLKLQVTVADALKGLEFIALSEHSQNHIALWSGGKRPILVPSFEGLMIDLAAIIPFLYTLFFGLRKDSQTAGNAFEDAVRHGIRARGLELAHQGRLYWSKSDYREIDAAVRIGDRLVLVECFAYDLPLDYEIGKPSVFEIRKDFILNKVHQDESLASRITAVPKGTNFDFSWAKAVEWRVVSPFVEFAWEIDEPLIDADGVPRVMQLGELLDYLEGGENPLDSRLLALLKKVHAYPSVPPRWY